MAHPLTERSCAELFKALADETRLKILHALFERDQCVTELMEALRLPQSHVSHHLKILKVAGLVEASREGQKMCYALHPKVRDNLSKTKAEALDLGCCAVTFR
jgi:ArsR family transcriptional regulator